MNDGLDDQLTNHENVSSPEPYFCRPMLIDEVVDAVTCASGKFRSVKGLLHSGQPASYYPPRADLFNFDGTLCFPRIGYPGRAIRETPRSTSRSTTSTWSPLRRRPTACRSRAAGSSADLPAGNYRLAVELGKEFDTQRRPPAPER